MSKRFFVQTNKNNVLDFFVEDNKEVKHLGSEVVSKEFYEKVKQRSIKESWEDLSLDDFDFDSDGQETVNDFYFSSSIIFISNLQELPSALDSRFYSVKLDLTKSEILDLIESLIDVLYTREMSGEQLKLDEKKEVLRLMRGLKTRTVKIDFRLFEKICALRHTGAKDWKETAYVYMTSGTEAKGKTL